ncbi:APC family permease [Mycetocola reblochoni]|uniref:Amino acid permease-associated region n=2 Tax=Mycetocola reblochoni TaxID=331618 RepID=A0A1R4JXY9_9MICO|nr:APC family permease [Mycetocola reblochoni]RLP67963.1 APC family permease [Mycetocola reblochoni]SJN37111.1 amino acid permease-associated region [Mycetocola reblochoni REB411]
MTTSRSHRPPTVPDSARSEGGAIDSGDAALNRGLGVGSIVFMVVAAAAPLGVVAANVPIVISTSGTMAAPLYFLLATAILVLFSVGYTTMTRFVPNAGAFYSYIQAGMGRRLGTGSAMLALLSYGLLFIGVNAYVGVATANALSAFTGWESPWWLWSLVSIAVIGLLGYRDIELSSKVLGVLLVAETLAVVIMDVVVIAQGGAEGLSARSLSPAELAGGTPSLGLMFAFFCFIGFEATAVFRSEARDPDRTIPRATYIAVVGIGLFYAVSSWAVVVGIGSEQAVAASTSDPENVVFAVVTTFVGPILSDVMQVLLATSFFACVLSFHNVITRYVFTLSGKRVLPARLGVVDPVHRAPSRASLWVSIVTGALSIAVMLGGLDPVAQVYTWFSGAATLGLIVLMALTSLAVVVFFRRNRGTTIGFWRGLLAPAVAFVSLGLVVAVVVQNLPLLVGSTLAAVIVAVCVVAAFAGGALVATRMRARDPEHYAQLAR